jgi:hypothetical protein
MRLSAGRIGGTILPLEFVPIPCEDRPSFRAPEENALMIVRTLAALLLVGAASTAARGDDAVPDLTPADFERLLAAIRPQPGESPWREIPWLTNVTKARRQASAENKPLVIFTAADGSPLSRT